MENNILKDLTTFGHVGGYFFLFEKQRLMTQHAVSDSS